MPSLDQDVEVKSKLKISPVVGLALVTLFGAGSASALFWFSNNLQKTTNQPTAKVTTIAATTSTTPLDLTKALNPLSATATTSTAYSDALAETNAIVQPSDISITITSPKEGASINDENGNYLTATLSDPNHKVASLYVRTFNDRYQYMIGWGAINVGTTPYSWNTALSMYPSGEYRDVVYARDAQGKFLASTDVMYTKTHDCYYLGYPDLTLTAPTTTISSGTKFTMTAAVKNNIRGACQNTYTVSTTDRSIMQSLLPDGWTATIVPANADSSGVSLGIGETKNFIITVTVPATTTSGIYSAGVQTNRLYTGLTTTKKATITVLKPTSGGGRLPSQIPDITPTN